MPLHPSAVVVAAAVAGFLLGPLLAAAADLVVARRLAADQHQPELGGGRLASRLTAAVGFAVIVIRFEPWWQRAPYLALVAVLIALSRVDATIGLLPNRIVWPSFGAGLLIVVSAWPLTGAGALLRAAVGTAVFAGVIGAVHLAYPAGMGRGDVKLALLLGLAVGWPQSSAIAAALLVFHALVAGSLVGIGQAAVAGALGQRGVEIPFGPAMAAGSIGALLVGPLLLA